MLGQKYYQLCKSFLQIVRYCDSNHTCLRFKLHNFQLQYSKLDREPHAIFGISCEVSLPDEFLIKLQDKVTEMGRVLDLSELRLMDYCLIKAVDQVMKKTMAMDFILIHLDKDIDNVWIFFMSTYNLLSKFFGLSKDKCIIVLGSYTKAI